MDEGIGRLDADGIWRVWREVVRAMSIRRMAWEFFFSRSIWSQWGVDYVSGLRRNRSSREVFGLLAPLAPADVRRLHAISAINHRRLEAVSRWTAVGVVTAPASAILMASQLAPAWLARQTLTNPDIVFLSASLALVLYILISAWRARQVLTVVELGLVELGLGLHGGEDALEDPIPEPMGT